MLHRLRTAILTGVLKPGERLVEVEVARQMAISRAPLREAIRQLEQEQLVVTIPRKGSFISEISDQGWWELYTIRATLERFAGQLAAERMTDADLDALKRIYSEMEAAAAEGNYSDLVERDLEFHEYICRRSEHGRLVTHWSAIRDHVRMFMAVKDRLYADLMEVVRTHIDVLEAVTSKDPDRLGDCLQKHITEAGALLITSLKQTSRHI